MRERVELSSYEYMGIAAVMPWCGGAAFIFMSLMVMLSPDITLRAMAFFMGSALLITALSVSELITLCRVWWNGSHLEVSRLGRSCAVSLSDVADLSLESRGRHKQVVVFLQCLCLFGERLIFVVKESLLSEDEPKAFRELKLLLEESRRSSSAVGAGSTAAPPPQ